MTDEDDTLDRKSIRYALGRHADSKGLSHDCVGLANAHGGRVLLGIEDDATEPPVGQHVPPDMCRTLKKRIGELTHNVGVTASVATAANGGEFVEITVRRSETGAASTSSGRYFLRIGDETKPVHPDELDRLLADRASLAWELRTTQRVPSDRADAAKLAAFCARVRASDRVSDRVKAKTERELVGHYRLVKDDLLTNLGVLWIGRAEDRAALNHAPEIQCIKWDERDRKVRKQVWDDHDLNPAELIDAVWRDVPDWRESWELPEGMFRRQVPHYDEVVVRELLANALVHRPYTQRGDVFLNLHPDRLEVVNPGRLPLGVTPRNILHVSEPRNPHLVRVFRDLGLMEGEGSGFDRMYEVLLASGRPVPEVKEGDDRVVVTVRKQILRPEIVEFMTKLDQAHEVGPKELIVAGLLARHESMTATALVRQLALRDADELRPWLGRLIDWHVVGKRGRTKGTEYFVEPDVLRTLKFEGPTTLRGIEQHRVQELVREDLRRHGRSGITQIHERIGVEIPRGKVERALLALRQEEVIRMEGSRRGAVYLWLG